MHSSALHDPQWLKTLMGAVRHWRQQGWEVAREGARARLGSRGCFDLLCNPSPWARLARRRWDLDHGVGLLSILTKIGAWSGSRTRSRQMLFGVFFLPSSFQRDRNGCGSESCPEWGLVSAGSTSHHQDPPSSTASPVPPLLPWLCCCLYPDVSDAEQLQPPAASPSCSVHVLLCAHSSPRGAPAPGRYCCWCGMPGRRWRSPQLSSWAISCLGLWAALETLLPLNTEQKSWALWTATWSSCSVVGGCFWGEVLVGKSQVRNGMIWMPGVDFRGHKFIPCLCQAGCSHL